MSISRRTLLASTGAAAVAATTLPGMAAAQTPSVTTTLTDAADYTVAKLRAVAPGVTSFPVGTKFEKWTFVANGDWVGGFWPGSLWRS